MTLRNFKSWKVRNSNGQRIDRVDRVLAWRVPHRRCWSKRFCRVDEWDVERELDLAELDQQDNKHDRCERRGYQRDHGITLWQDNPSLLNLEFVERDRPDDRFGAKVTIPLDDRGEPDRQFLCMRNCTDADQVPERSSRHIDSIMKRASCSVVSPKKLIFTSSTSGTMGRTRFRSWLCGAVSSPMILVSTGWGRTGGSTRFLDLIRNAMTMISTVSATSGMKRCMLIL